MPRRRNLVQIAHRGQAHRPEMAFDGPTPCRVRRNGTVDSGFDVSLHNHQSPASYFCPRIGRDRFRELAAEVEQMVSRRNYRRWIRRLVSRRTLTRLGELSVQEAARRFLTYLRSART